MVCTWEFSHHYSICHNDAFLFGECVTESNLYPDDGGSRCPYQVFAPSSVLETLAGDRYQSKPAERHFLIHWGLWLEYCYRSLRFSVLISRGLRTLMSKDFCVRSPPQLLPVTAPPKFSNNFKNFPGSVVHRQMGCQNNRGRSPNL